MKKSIWHLSRCAVVCTAFLWVQQITRSQVSDPSTWDSFTQSEANRSVRDTFRMQTFEGLPSDNWNYTTTGEVSIEDLSTINIPNAKGDYGLRMPMGSQAAFEHFPLTHYQDVKISVHKGGIHLMQGEEMRVRTYRAGETTYPSIVTLIKSDATNPFSTTIISKNPPGVDIIIPAPAANTQNGCYYVDSIYAHGMIPAYSLYTGSGNWTDPIRWSHTPAYRHRDALIKGEVSIHTGISCGDLHLAEGNILISSTGELYVDNLTIYSDDNASSPSAFLRSSGAIHIAAHATIEKTFAEKGKWYFISFPFDIYASGIDPDFQLGDDTSDTNGNYFYLRTYNGEKRASQQSMSGNWEVIPKTIANTTQPLFKKNKGYLIALDASADRQCLRFSSKAGDIPTGFGKNGQASIPVSINLQSQSQDHNGWYLCGNPLPAPLSLGQIEPNPALDGYIYIYDGSTYRPYPIGSDFAIPPFSAFFVKANKNTFLTSRSSSTPANYQLLSAIHPLASLKAEPLANQESTVSNQPHSAIGIKYYLRHKTLFIENLPDPGKVELYDPLGTLVFRQSFEAGSSVFHLPLTQGLYILNIQTGHDQAQYKCVLTP